MGRLCPTCGEPRPAWQFRTEGGACELCRCKRQARDLERRSELLRRRAARAKADLARWQEVNRRMRHAALAQAGERV